MQGVPTPLALIGLGSVGLRLALAWKRAGLHVTTHSPSPSSRERARAVGLEVVEELGSAVRAANCIVLCVGEPVLEQAATEAASALGPGERPISLHTCGSRGPSALAVLAARPCPVGTLHPLAAFSPGGPGPNLSGAWFAISGDAPARAAASQLASVLRAKTFSLQGSDEAALRYHTAASLLANGTVALASLSMELAQQACLDPKAARSAFLALLESTLDNLEQGTPESALTGPVSRGDVKTVSSHLKGLDGDPRLKRVYLDLSLRMLELAQRDGRLDAAQIRAMDRLLAQ